MNARRASRSRCTALRVAALLPLLAFGPGCGRDASDASHAHTEPLPVVEVLRLVPQPYAQRLELLGQLEAEESVVVRPEIQGMIEGFDFVEGAPVREGQVLFTLRDAEHVARLHEARAELALAEDVYRRTQSLVERRVESTVQLARARSQREVMLAKAELAEVALARTRIRAPFDGQAGPRLVSPGAAVDEQTDLVEIQGTAVLELSFTIPEQVVPLARVGIPFELQVAPYPGESFPGEISFVAPGLNPSNRRLLVKGRVPNSDGRLRPGLFARIATRVGEREAALVLPEEAVVFEAEGPVVWRLGEGNAVQPVRVELGSREPGRVEIRAGLAAGDTVVVAGTHKLAPGALVSPKPMPAASAREEAASAGAAPDS